MASPASLPATIAMASITLAAFFLCCASDQVSSPSPSSSPSLSCEQYFHGVGAPGCCPPVKCVSLEFYIHDLREPEPYSNASDVGVAGNGTSFGGITVVDSKVTETPDFFSKELGRSGGLLVSDAMPGTMYTVTVMVTVNLTVGDRKGTISLFGQDTTSDSVRVVNVIGGTGDYNLARGNAYITAVATSADLLNTVLKVIAYLLVS